MKTVFLIQLIQDDDGPVRAVSEAVGTGARAYEIGIEIMANLKAASYEHPEMIAVQSLEYSTQWQ